MEPNSLNWTAVIIGTVMAYGLGMIWFSPLLFGRGWSAGSHNLKPPKTMPVAAMAAVFAGTFLLALTIGLAGTGTGLVAIATAAVLVAGMSLYGQKSTYAVLVDGGYVAAMGALMLAAQAVL